MIRVLIKRHEQSIVDVCIQDHANYAEKGLDLVCAGVSSIAVGIMNALDELAKDTCTLEMKEAYIRIKVKQCENPTTQMILKILCIQLETMQEAYKKYIKINDQEV